MSGNIELRPSASYRPSGGFPLELLLVIALFVGCGAWVNIWVFAKAVPDLSGIFDVWGARIGLVIAGPFLFTAALGIGLIIIAVLLHRGSRVGRGLAYVALAWIMATFIISESAGFVDGTTPGSALTTTVIVVGIVAAAILAFSPGVQAHFAAADGLDTHIPASVTTARVLMITIAVANALAAFLYILAIDYYTTETVMLVSMHVVTLVAFAAAAAKLVHPNHIARTVTTGVPIIAVIVIFFIVGDGWELSVIPALGPIAIPFLLWLPADSRRWFGDTPVNLLASVTPPSGTARTANVGGSARTTSTTQMPRHAHAVEVVAVGGVSPSGALALTAAGDPAIAGDEVDLVLADVRIGGGWLEAAQSVVSMRDDLIFMNADGRVRITSRRLLIAADETAADVGIPASKRCVSVPLEDIQLLFAGDAIAIGVRHHATTSWLHLSGAQATRGLAVRLAHAAAARRLTLRPRDQRRAQLESLQQGAFERIADLGGEFHLWEDLLNRLASTPALFLPQVGAPVANDNRSAAQEQRRAETGHGDHSGPPVVADKLLRWNTASPEPTVATAAAEIPALCGNCDTPIIEDDQFCSRCGAPRNISTRANS